ncbi:MAG: CYTH domain-containing protein [Flavobacteriaceae bacterium]|nr:CYTH domain-containing protein [Flavobacteriaceae bacterium]
MIEIERKFLVSNNSFLNDFSRSNRIVQGYLSSHPERTVRVRIKGENGYLTIKGKSEGFSRYEWEKEIAIEDAEKLLALCEPSVIDKIRYEIIVGTHVYEVDVFYGENEGLVLAEIELQSENETFEKPNWLGKEVTDDIRYYNSYLSKTPYKNW